MQQAASKVLPLHWKVIDAVARPAAFALAAYGVMELAKKVVRSERTEKPRTINVFGRNIMPFAVGAIGGSAIAYMVSRYIPAQPSMGYNPAVDHEISNLEFAVYCAGVFISYYGTKKQNAGSARNSS